VEYSLFCLGFITVLLGLYLILNSYGVWNVYLNNLNIFKGSSESSYSFSRLFRTYLDDFIRFVPHLIVVSLLILPLSSFYGYSKLRRNKGYLLVPVCLL